MPESECVNRRRRQMLSRHGYGFLTFGLASASQPVSSFFGTIFEILVLLSVTLITNLDRTVPSFNRLQVVARKSVSVGIQMKLIEH